MRHASHYAIFLLLLIAFVGGWAAQTRHRTTHPRLHCLAVIRGPTHGQCHVDSSQTPASPPSAILPSSCSAPAAGAAAARSQSASAVAASADSTWMNSLLHLLLCILAAVPEHMDQIIHQLDNFLLRGRTISDTQLTLEIKTALTPESRALFGNHSWVRLRGNHDVRTSS